MRMRIEVREVLAGAYRKRDTAMLTHAVMQIHRGHWQDAEVLCKRVDFNNLADRNSGVDVKGEPTCKSCRAAFRRYRSNLVGSDQT